MKRRQNERVPFRFPGKVEGSIFTPPFFLTQAQVKPALGGRGTRRLLALLLTLLVLLGGCGSLDHASAPAPAVVDDSGAQLPDAAPSCTANPELADTLRAAILQQSASVTVRGYPLDIVEACLAELLDDPALFWCTGYHLTATTVLTTTVEITFRWLYDDGPARYAMLCAAADEVLAAAPEGDYAMALYLYDWLQTRVTYTAHEGYDQTAYAAICEGSAVCGGIADAYTFLLTRAGIPARTVMGTASDGGQITGHAWNLAVLDGAAYCFDLTWDNSDRYDTAGTEYLMHNWFAVTSAAFNPTHTPSNSADAIQTRANAANYYIREGYVLTEDSDDAILAILRPQMEQGSNVLTFRCADRTVYDAVSFRLFDLKEAVGVLRALGLAGYGSIEWTYSLQGELYTVTIYR